MSDTRPISSLRSADWLPALDGLRGVSILVVLTSHVFIPGWTDLGGHFGVTVFFVLSGFLITRLLLREESENTFVDLRSFYIRRAFRLFPAYYFVLGLYCALLFGLQIRPQLTSALHANLPYYLVYLQEIPFFRDRGPATPQAFYQSWSLGIEEKFYLVWPLLAFVALKTARARALVAGAGVLLFSAAQTLTPAGRYVFPYASIFAGCLLALAYADARFRSRVLWLSRAPGAALAVAAWLTLHVVAVVTVGGVEWTAELLYPVAVSVVLIAALSPNWLGRLLSARPLVVLGNLSYGIYLLHLLVRNVVELALKRAGVAHPQGLFVYGAMLVGSVVAAWVMQVGLENPARRYGRALADRSRARAGIRALP